MAVFWITTNFCPNGRTLQFPFDCEFDSVDALAAEVSVGKLAVGDKLTGTDDGRGGKLIVKRERIALGAGQIGIVQNADKRFWEPED